MYNKSIVNKIRKIIPLERFRHSLAVATLCQKIASYHKVSEKKAFLAGLLHDVAKDFSSRKIIGMVRNDPKIKGYKTIPSLHGIAGAEFVKKEFKITDEEVLNAIAYHVIPQDNPTPLEKIVYIADKLEINKDFPNRGYYIKLSLQNLDKCFEEMKKNSKKIKEEK
ncbi:MAG: bis(5'-nucleosyl)-tetraphosphatase (symmetrical) YqeK [Mycoplasmataceae bacterium]|jgi:predicted HD superfamily hydrolase involved in NAD metabolism|nr:bis(5'-nucleosyl)-tetraphosphatase (symmetrical) YqeK [Mycoplasmataceae bacterium]